MLFVLDTNVLLSGLLFPHSQPSQAIFIAISLGQIAISEAVLSEYKEVFARQKFDRFISIQERVLLLDNVLTHAQNFEIIEAVTECRDPKDNKFLELALASSASCIVSGDNALLILHPFRGISILSPSDFLQTF